MNDNVMPSIVQVIIDDEYRTPEPCDVIISANQTAKLYFSLGYCWFPLFEILQNIVADGIHNISISLYHPSKGISLYYNRDVNIFIPHQFIYDVGGDGTKVESEWMLNPVYKCVDIPKISLT